MTEAFADTFYWVGLLNPRDANHQRVSQYPLPYQLVTAGAVRIEVMNALSDHRLRRPPASTGGQPSSVWALPARRLV